jgi:putative NADPH-quinone reductase
MHVLLIYCHPRPDSFCAAVRDAALAGLDASGHTFEVRDLYAETFLPVMTVEQRGRYYSEDANLEGVEEHVAALQRADALVLVYPTWWFGLPAMLKGWFDRVWVPGVAFSLREGEGLRPLLTRIRRIGVVTTYGSPLWLLWLIRWPDRRMIRAAFLSLCARNAKLDWLAMTSMDRCTLAQRQHFLSTVQARFSRWH